MGKYLGGVTVSGYIAPSDTADQYATHRASLGLGGYRSALDIPARDAITSLRREEGMVVYVISTEKEYRLVGGIENTNWQEIIASTGTGTGTGETNYLIVNALTDRDSLADTNRKIGLICYVIVEDKEYRLVGGIANNNWQEIVSSVGTGTSDCCNYLIVNSLTDIENYPVEKRFIGLTLYAKDADKEFRFVSGIENVNLKEINSTLVNYNPDGTITITNPDTTSGTNTTIDPTNNITNVAVQNNYYNTIGCLNKSKIAEILNSGGSALIPVYTDKSGAQIPSVADVNEFSFKINKSDFWVDDWVYFTGSTKTETGKTPEIIFEIKEAGTTIDYNILEILNGTIIKPTNLVLFGTTSKWYGYFKGTSVGRKDIRVYENLDGIKIATMNKTIYFFAPNFSILDGASTTPTDIQVSTTLMNKEYQFNVLSNTNLMVNLARVQVSSYGIDTNNYMVIPGTSQVITADGKYTIPSNILKSLVDGKYSLVVTGSDAGVTIPTYFYGPFNIKVNYISGTGTGTSI